jgi:PTH1 family peptidyl-tRNA hydrolase
MHLIVGLGNPGKEYAATRHNVGWMVVDALAEKYGFSPWVKKHKGLVATGKIGDEAIVLLKPQTWMNVSGDSVQPAAKFYKIKPANILVIHDDIDLAFLDLRHKTGGGDAGHNGLKSITQALGPEYRRLRIGVGRPAYGDVADYVLQKFSKAEAERLGGVLKALVDHMADLLADAPKALAHLKLGV